jgi:hypothetical protein
LRLGLLDSTLPGRVECSCKVPSTHLASTALVADFQHRATGLRPVWPMSHADGPTCVLAGVEGAVQGQVGEVTLEQINLFDVVVSDDACLDSVQSGFPSSQAGEDRAVTGAEDLLRHPADAERCDPSDVGRIEELPLLLHGLEYADIQPPLWLGSGDERGPVTETPVTARWVE